jgi:hypothetical protein
MVRRIRDIKLTVRDLLRDNWDNSQLPVALDESDIHTGWFDDGKGYPQVSISNEEGGPKGGGETGYVGIDGSGEGGTQLRSGYVLVTAWAGSRADYENRGEDELQADEMAWVIEDAINDNQAPGDLTSLAVGNRTALVDDDETPVEHAVQFQVQFTWHKTPR